MPQSILLFCLLKQNEDSGKVVFVGEVEIEWESSGDYTTIFYCYPNFLNNFFADPYKITASKGGLTRPLKI